MAYRGLFTLLPFPVSLVAVLSFLHVDALLVWLTEKVPAPLPVCLGGRGAAGAGVQCGYGGRRCP